jgi:hypothetical protein
MMSHILRDLIGKDTVVLTVVRSSPTSALARELQGLVIPQSDTHRHYQVLGDGPLEVLLSRRLHEEQELSGQLLTEENLPAFLRQGLVSFRSPRLKTSFVSHGLFRRAMTPADIYTAFSYLLMMERYESSPIAGMTDVEAADGICEWKQRNPGGAFVKKTVPLRQPNTSCDIFWLRFQPSNAVASQFRIDFNSADAYWNLVRNEIGGARENNNLLLFFLTDVLPRIS